MIYKVWYNADYDGDIQRISAGMMIDDGETPGCPTFRQLTGLCEEK